jgi:hypothetical protein
MVEFMQGTTIMSRVYCETLKELRTVIHNKRCGTLPSSVLAVLLHDNARPHTATYLHSSTAVAFQLGIVWLPFLQPWSRSERLPPIYLPEEPIGITVLQQ